MHWSCQDARGLAITVGSGLAYAKKAGETTSTRRMGEHLSRTRLERAGAAEPGRDGLRGANPGAGADHPVPAAGPRRDRPGADRHGEDRRVWHSAGRAD